MPVTLYGLKTCDASRGAARELQGSGRKVAFRDIRDAPLTSDEIAWFLARFGADLVNRRSTTWRGLSEAERMRDPAELLAAHPALMKRPVIADGETVTLGWDRAARNTHLG